MDGLEPGYATAIARAYNDWMKDFCDFAPQRMFGAGMVAPHDVSGAVDESRRCVEELGFKAIFLAPATVNRRPWHHPAARARAAEQHESRVVVIVRLAGAGHAVPGRGPGGDEAVGLARVGRQAAERVIQEAILVSGI